MLKYVWIILTSPQCTSYSLHAGLVRRVCCKAVLAPSVAHARVRLRDALPHYLVLHLPRQLTRLNGLPQRSTGTLKIAVGGRKITLEHDAFTRLDTLCLPVTHKCHGCPQRRQVSRKECVA